MRQSLMTVDAGVAQRRVLVAAEGEDGGVHALGVEDLQLDQQVEVRHRQARDGQEQLRLDPGDDIDQRILAEIGQVHERRDARREFDQLFLNLLAQRIIFLTSEEQRVGKGGLSQCSIWGSVVDLK